MSTEANIICSIKQLLERSKVTSKKSVTESPRKSNDALVNQNIPFSSSPSRCPSIELRTGNDRMDKDGVETHQSILAPTAENREESPVRSTPSFSLGLTQEERQAVGGFVNEGSKSQDMTRSIPNTENREETIVSSTPSFSLGLTQEQHQSGFGFVIDGDKSNNMASDMLNEKSHSIIDVVPVPESPDTSTPHGNPIDMIAEACATVSHESPYILPTPNNQSPDGLEGHNIEKFPNANLESDKRKQGEQVLAVRMKEPINRVVPTTPLFSTGFTQEKRQPTQSGEVIGVAVHNKDAKEVVEQAYQQCKRQKIKDTRIVKETLRDINIEQHTGDGISGSDPKDVDPQRVEERWAKVIEKMRIAHTLNINGVKVSSKELFSILDRTTSISVKMIDVIISHMRLVFAHLGPSLGMKKVEFFDTKFLVSLLKNLTKFNKNADKGTHQFQKALIERVVNGIGGATCFYFPFCLDKKHWVGIGVDCPNSMLHVLDCGIGLRSDSVIAKEVAPISEMFPYLLKQAGRYSNATHLEPLQVVRIRDVPQTTTQSDSAVVSVLLMQAHAIGGVDVCKCITQEAIVRESKVLVVSMFEAVDRKMYPSQ